MTRFNALATLAAFCGVALVSTPHALAQKINVDIEALDPIQLTPKELKDGKKPKNPPPRFEAHVAGAAAGLSAKEFELKQLDSPEPFQVKAIDVKTFPESNEKLALVVLIQGCALWMGNEMFYEGEDAPREGAFAGLGPVLDTLKKAGPPGSLAAVLLFGDGKADARMTMGPIGDLNAGVLGSQKDYDDKLDCPLLVGLSESIAILDNHPGYRKALVVIGDGTGASDEIGTELAARIKDLQERKIEVYSIHYEPIESGSPVGQQNMTRLGYTDHRPATSRDNFSTFAQAFVDAINAVYYVTFPGCVADVPPSPATCFTHDGNQHEFALVLQGEERDPVDVQTKKWDVPKPPEETSLWWLWLLLGLLLVVVIVAILVKRAQNRPMPEPMPMPMPEMEAPPPPAPAGPAKTMMLGIGGNNDGLPVVGWIVPLNGPNQYQTFKLLDGVTKIGTGGEANVVVNDTFMSTVHCQIVSSPSGFRLKDGGSTNGTYVNEKRAGEHDLVDNDQLTMGKTNFKFKSIL